jgi:hypothetical protein
MPHPSKTETIEDQAAKAVDPAAICSPLEGYGKAVLSREMMTSATMTPEEELAVHCRKCPSCLQKLAELKTSLGMLFLGCRKCSKMFVVKANASDQATASARRC